MKREDKLHVQPQKRNLRIEIWLVALLLISQQILAQSSQSIRITIHKKDAPLEEVLKEVKLKTDYALFYNSDLVKNIRTTVWMNNAPLKDVLNKAFEKTSLTYSIEEKTIIVSKSRRTDPPRRNKMKKIFGIVKDDQDNPLIGATIKIGNTNIGTLTNTTGNFQIDIPVDAQSFSVSYIGMESKTIHIGKNEAFTIILHEDAQLLSNVVVTGYQKISRERAAGSFSILNSKTIEQRHVSNVSQSLEGLVAGIQGTDDERGGKKFSIRGKGTMYGNDSPLIVVDGFPITDTTSSSDMGLNAFQKINPNDVESITILKDAAAASIWGARSANGVIVITTKRGNNKDKLRVEANSQISISNKYNVDEISNSARSTDFINYERKAFENNWTSGEYSGAMTDLQMPVTLSELLLYKGMRFKSISTDEMNQGLAKLAALDNRQQIKKYLLKRPIVSQVNASISGGNDRFDSYLSLMYQKNIGAIIGNKSDSYFINFNNDFKLNKHITLTAGLNLQHIDEQSTPITISDIRNLSPYEMLLNEDGSYATNVGQYNTDILNMYPWKSFSYQNMGYNILQEARSRDMKTKHLAFRTQFGLNAKIIDGLNFNSKFQYEENNYNYENYSNEESFFVRNMVNYYTTYDMSSGVVGTSAIPLGGIMMTGKGKSTASIWRNDFSFDKVFGEKHAICFVVGNEISNYKTTSRSNPYMYGYNPDTEIASSLSSTKAKNIEGWEISIPGTKANLSWNKNKYVSFYGNASYTFDEKYSISVSARSDASNLITSQPKYRWSPLWSVGLLWNMEHENFLKNNPIVNRLALRATYGQNGNACSSSSARTTISTVSSSLDEATGKNPGEIYDYGNPTLRWEKTSTTNIGIDFALFSNRLFGSIDFYNKKGTDILGNTKISGVNGTTNVIFNNSSLLNRGIEITIGSNLNLGNSGITLGGTLTYAYNYNKVLDLYNDSQLVSDILNASYIEGRPMNPIFAFHYLGMEDGKPMIDNGSGGKIAIDDFSLMFGDNSKALRYMGTSVSPHTLGLNLNLSWKGLMWQALLNGRFGGKFKAPIFNYPIIQGMTKTTVNAQYADVLDGDNSIPSLPQGEDTGYQNWTTYLNYLDTKVENSSYIYFKEMILDYTLPQLLVEKIKLKNISIFSKVENIGLLWTANKKHYHPEYLPGTPTPATTYTIGIRINL